jgi:predicted nucleic acid-binding Zn ribbon protein
LVENKHQNVDIIMFDVWILIAFWIILWLHH